MGKLYLFSCSIKNCNFNNYLILFKYFHRFRCVHHEGEKLSVFCISCQMCICHLCALFVGQVTLTFLKLSSSLAIPPPSYLINKK